MKASAQPRFLNTKVFRIFPARREVIYSEITETYVLKYEFLSSTQRIFYMKLTVLLSILLFSTLGHSKTADCYKMWDENSESSQVLLKYEFKKTKSGLSVYDCGRASETCAFLTKLKDDPANTDFSQCKVSGDRRTKFSACHGDDIPTVETQLGPMVVISISARGKAPRDYLCDETFFEL